MFKTATRHRSLEVLSESKVCFAHMPVRLSKFGFIPPSPPPNAEPSSGA